MLDEPTVDDQHANSQIAAIAAGELVARLVITQGNDIGQEVEIRPGKSYTIGRAIDNDVVLTDIAVSRKHFDLRFEDGAWVIVDRGSGNGTVVNGNVEDNPFMLANGDTIEIGNTVFRFDQPNAAGRPMNTFDVDMDEELSTVAGKPMRNDRSGARARPARARVMYARPKTLPPPTPIRPRSPSTFPAPPQHDGAAPAAAARVDDAAAADGGPCAAMPRRRRRRPRRCSPASRTRRRSAARCDVSRASRRRSAPLMANYPQYSELPPGRNLGPLMISPNGQRHDASTAHVSPTPYDGRDDAAAGAAARDAERPAELAHEDDPRRRRPRAARGRHDDRDRELGRLEVARHRARSGVRRREGLGDDAQVDARLPAPAPSETPKQEPPPQEPPKQIAVVRTPTQDPPKQETPKQIVTPAEAGDAEEGSAQAGREEGSAARDAQADREEGSAARDPRSESPRQEIRRSASPPRRYRRGAHEGRRAVSREALHRGGERARRPRRRAPTSPRRRSCGTSRTST